MGMALMASNHSTCRASLTDQHEAMPWEVEVADGTRLQQESEAGEARPGALEQLGEVLRTGF